MGSAIVDQLRHELAVQNARYAVERARRALADAEAAYVRAKRAAGLADAEAARAATQAEAREHAVVFLPETLTPADVIDVVGDDEPALEPAYVDPYENPQPADSTYALITPEMVTGAREEEPS